MKRFGQKGFLHLHVILPVLLVVAAVGAIGTYVLHKSGASSDTKATGYSTCGTPKHESKVYAAAVNTQNKFSSAKNNDSIRNIAYGLCTQGYLDAATAQHANKSGNYDPEIQKAYARMQVAQFKGSETNGVPEQAGLSALNLSPVGF
jgi:murein L,D-transpeptidase YcbB/YkuD